MSRVRLELPSFALLCAWRIQSHQPVQVDCFLHVSHFRIGSQDSCRLDQQMLFQLVSECRAKLLYPTQMLNFPSDTSIKFITSSTFLSNAAPASQSTHCFQQLADFAIDGHEDNSCRR